MDNVWEQAALIAFVMLGETKLHGQIFTVVDGVILSEEDVTGDEEGAARRGNVEGDDSGGAAAIQVESVILGGEGVAIAFDDVGNVGQIINVFAVG